MRVDSTTIETLVSSLGGLNSRQAEITAQLSSGVRLNHLSDDPAATGVAIAQADALRRNDVFIATAATAGNRLQASDTALSSAVTQLTSAVATAVGAYNGTGAAARAIAVQQLQSVRESLLSLANSSYSGSYLFAGGSTQRPFTQAADGTVTYSGDAGGSSVALVSGDTLQTSPSGALIFLAAGGSVFSALNSLIVDLGQASTSGDGSVTVGALRDALSSVISQRAALNTTQKRLSTESDYSAAQKTNLQVQQGTLLSAEPAALATELSAVTTQRTALLNTIGLIGKNSLFDYLR